MSSERKTNWIVVYTPKGERRIMSPQAIRKLLGIDLGSIAYRISTLERRIERVESPARQKRIIETLRDQGKHNHVWLSNRVAFHWYDLSDLIEKGTILTTRSGTQTMLELKEGI